MLFRHILSFMPPAIASVPPDSDPPTRVPVDNSSSRCHVVQIVRHVPLPQLEALHGTPEDKPKTIEGQVIEGIVPNPEKDVKATVAGQDLDVSQQTTIQTAEDSGQILGPQVSSSRKDRGQK